MLGLYGIVNAGQAGWGSTVTLACLGAALVTAVLGAGLWLPAVAHANPRNGAAPKPIPSGQQFFGPGTELFHVFLGRGVENSTITDFNGAIAAAHILGTVTEIRGSTRTPGLLVDGDLRFMQGAYIGVDGRHYNGTFGFF